MQPRFDFLVLGARVAPILLAIACGGSTNTAGTDGGSTSECVSVESQICAEAAKLGVVGDPCSTNQDPSTVQHFSAACEVMRKHCGAAAKVECSD